jgi:ABC-2 type transport system permease protein
MDIIKLSTDWARAEVFSAKIIWLFSIIEIAAAIGFWYLGRTAMAKALGWPFLVAGLFLLMIGGGLYFSNQPRIKRFEMLYQKDPTAFMQQEIGRTAKSQKELALVFKILPAVIIAAALLILLIPAPLWRAIGITTIITAAFLMVVDSNTDARNTAYHSQLTASIP